MTCITSNISRFRLKQLSSNHLLRWHILFSFIVSKYKGSLFIAKHHDRKYKARGIIDNFTRLRLKQQWPKPLSFNSIILYLIICCLNLTRFNFLSFHIYKLFQPLILPNTPVWIKLIWSLYKSACPNKYLLYIIHKFVNAVYKKTMYMQFSLVKTYKLT